MNLLAFNRGLRDGIAIAIRLFFGLLFFWDHGGGLGNQLVAGRADLPDKSDFIRSVCRELVS